jgi:hypothetical protein
VIDYKVKRADLGARSMQGHVQYDCKNQRKRLLSITTYSGEMMGGRKVHSDSTIEKWGAITSNSSDDVISGFVCAR